MSPHGLVSMSSYRNKKNSIKAVPELSQQARSLIQADMAAAYDSYESGLSKRALFKTNNIEISEDLVQTTFLKTLMYLQKGGKIDTMRSFLSHVLNDLIIDEYRKNKSLSLDVLLEKGYEPDYDERERTINIIDGREVIMLIPSIPKKYQVILQLRYMQSLSLKEIAQITNQSPNTVAVQAHRGLHKLKALYDKAHNVV